MNGQRRDGVSWRRAWLDAARCGRWRGAADLVGNAPMLAFRPLRLRCRAAARRLYPGPSPRSARRRAELLAADRQPRRHRRAPNPARPVELPAAAGAAAVQAIAPVVPNATESAARQLQGRRRRQSAPHLGQDRRRIGGDRLREQARRRRSSSAIGQKLKIPAGPLAPGRGGRDRHRHRPRLWRRMVAHRLGQPARRALYPAHRPAPAAAERGGGGDDVGRGSAPPPSASTSAT